MGLAGSAEYRARLTHLPMGWELRGLQRCLGCYHDLIGDLGKKFNAVDETNSNKFECT